MLWQNDCKPLGLDPTKNPVQVIIISFSILILIPRGIIYTPFQKRIYHFRSCQIIRLVRRKSCDHTNNGKLVGNSHRRT